MPDTGVAPTETSHGSSGGGRPGFVSTRWTVVLDAAEGTSARAQVALATLCQTYWFPLYVYMRRLGYRPPDAEDLTQAFWVVRPQGQPEPVRIGIGITNGTHTEIVEGPREGEHVITALTPPAAGVPRPDSDR